MLLEPPFFRVTKWWENGRKTKGCVSMRAKRYIRKADDTFELWAGRPDKGGLLVAVVTKDAVTAKNVDKYDRRACEMWALFGLYVSSELKSVAKNRNYTHLCSWGYSRWSPSIPQFPFHSESGIDNEGRLINSIPPLKLQTSKDTEKKIRTRIKEWRAMFDTMYQLLKKDISRGEYKLNVSLPDIDAPVDGGVALSLLEWSRNRTSEQSYMIEYDSLGNYVTSGWKDSPTFSKNLIEKCLAKLREHWRRTSPDSTWIPVSAR